jgi:hypothetical protein
MSDQGASRLPPRNGQGAHSSNGRAAPQEPANRITALLAENNAEAPPAGVDIPTAESPPPRPRRGRVTRSSDEFQSRISHAALLLSQMQDDAVVCKYLVARYQCSRKMGRIYIAHAKKMIRTWTETPAGEWRDRILAVLTGILKAPGTKVNEKLATIDRLTRLLGLEPGAATPAVSICVGAGGSPTPTRITVISSREELEQLNRARLELARAKQGADAGAGRA